MVAETLIGNASLRLSVLNRQVKHACESKRSSHLIRTQGMCAATRAWRWAMLCTFCTGAVASRSQCLNWIFEKRTVQDTNDRGDARLTDRRPESHLALHHIDRHMTKTQGEQTASRSESAGVRLPRQAKMQGKNCCWQVT